jgi:methionyl-tRNA formyltransferase
MAQKMRIIFMGTPEFAAGTLDTLLKNGKNVVAVVTAADKPAGRGRQLNESAVKVYAAKNNIHVLQPHNLKEPGFLSELRSLQADLQIVVAFRMLPEEVWNMPPHGTYNLHASLLPKYRGAAPINRAIMNGETVTGVTTFKLKHEIDTGNILFQEKVMIDERMNAGMLHDQLMVTGAKLMLRTVEEIERSAGSGAMLQFMPQDDSKASHAPKIFREDCRINWDMPAKKIYDQIRGLSPYPGAFTLLNIGGQEQVWKIFSSDYEEDNHGFTNGSLLTDGKTYLKIRCGNGVITVTELQAQGRKRMMVNEFLRGFKIPEGSMAV